MLSTCVRQQGHLESRFVAVQMQGEQNACLQGCVWARSSISPRQMGQVGASFSSCSFSSWGCESSGGCVGLTSVWWVAWAAAEEGEDKGRLPGLLLGGVGWEVGCDVCVGGEGEVGD